jgi:hypothetical protein
LQAAGAEPDEPRMKQTPVGFIFFEKRANNLQKVGL